MSMCRQTQKRPNPRSGAWLQVFGSVSTSDNTLDAELLIHLPVLVVLLHAGLGFKSGRSSLYHCQPR